MNVISLHSTITYHNISYPTRNDQEFYVLIHLTFYKNNYLPSLHRLLHLLNNAKLVLKFSFMVSNAYIDTNILNNHR